MFKLYAKILIVILFWASLYQLAPLPLKYVDIYLVALIRYVFASLILIFIHYYYTKTIFPKLNLKQWLYVFSIGFFGVFLYNITFLWAEKLISGNIVAMIYAFSPCIITILSSYLFKMKINFQAKLGILVALLGTIGIILFSSSNGGKECYIGTNLNLGEILSVLSVFLFSAYAILGKFAVKENVSMITINTYSSIVGMVLFAIVCMFKSDFSSLQNTDLAFWSSMLYISIFATVIAYIWYLQSLEDIGIYKTAVFQNMLPFLVIAIGFVALGETISILSLLFGGVVFLGVYMTNVAVNKK